MSGKAPKRPPSRLETLRSELRAIEDMWNQEDMLCERALEKETKQGDDEAIVHYNNCMSLSKRKDELQAEIAAIEGKKDTVAQAVDQAYKRDFGPIQKLPGIRKGGKQTRRRKRGGAGSVWEIVRQVCGALGLRTCPLDTPTPEMQEAVKEANPIPFDQWGPPPEQSLTFSFKDSDPGKPPVCPKVVRRVPESELIKKEALYLRQVAKDLNAKGNRELANRFMGLAKEAYMKSCATKQVEEEKRYTPEKYMGIAEQIPEGKHIGDRRQGGKTRRHKKK